MYVYREGSRRLVSKKEIEYKYGIMLYLILIYTMVSILAFSDSYKIDHNDINLDYNVAQNNKEEW